jgi:hypothetical protein
MNLIPWMIAWATVTTAVLVLGFYRLTLGLHEDPGMYIDANQAHQAEAKAAIDAKISRIELYGKTLTVVAALLMSITLILWVYGALTTGARLS